MKSLKKIATIFAISIMLSSTAYAMNGSVAFGPKVGVQGIGLEARTKITENIFSRVGFNYFEYTKNFKDGQINLKGKLTLLSAPIMLDWHPFDQSGFKLSAGASYNGNKFKGKASPSRAVIIDSVTYTPTEVGSVTAELTLNNAIAAVATLGYDSSFLNNNPWSFNFEAGVMYAGNPKLSVTSTGIGGADAKSAIEKDIRSGLNDAKKFLRFFPVLSLGFKYTF